MSNFEVEKIRTFFPQLTTTVYDKKLVYLDNAATTLKPKSVIEAIEKYYSVGTANIHRGVHYLGQKATDDFEACRKTVAQFIGATSENEIIFTKGTTESINLCAHILGLGILQEGDEVLLTQMEHHSNIVPWQLLREQKKIVIKVAPINQQGEIIFEEWEKLLSKKTKVASFVYVSNSLGTINPVEKMIKAANKAGVITILDGAQAVSHLPINVSELGVDFFAFSGHKLFGPTGIGVLFGKKTWLDKLPPYQGGGDMILSVTFEKTIFNVAPHKFEAGTPPIAEVIGLGPAINFVQAIGLAKIKKYEDELLKFATDELEKVPGFKIIGTSKNKASVISFILDEIHPHDVGTFLDQDGIAIRAGHHCTQPVMDFFKVPATNRASFSFYNTEEEVMLLKKSLIRIREFFL